MSKRASEQSERSKALTRGVIQRIKAAQVAAGSRWPPDQPNNDTLWTCTPEPARGYAIPTEDPCSHCGCREVHPVDNGLRGLPLEALRAVVVAKGEGS